MNKVIIHSPTRVDFAGGTLDLWPLFNFVGGAKTVNVAIDIFTRAEIVAASDSSIELFSEDLKLAKKYANLEECLADQDPRLHLLQVQLKFWKPKTGFKLTTKSDSPIGGGLGGSSSLTISMLKAFELFCQTKKMNTTQMVHVAHNMEAQVLNTPTGTQDYFPAVSGGLNILSYSYEGIHQEVLSVEDTDLEKNFLLVYTGKSHHSGINNFEVMQKAVAKDPQVLKALYDIKDVAEQMAQVCRQGKWKLLPDLFKREFDSRIKLANSFSSPEIEKLAHLTLQAGAQAVKICGAGGGGCVLVWTEPAHRQGVIEVCQKAGFNVLSARPVAPLRG